MKTMTKQKPKGIAGRLVYRDILLREEEGGGFGLYGSPARTPSHWARLGVEDAYQAAQAVDAAVLGVANELGWTGDQLHEFMNSKPGRWAGDDLRPGCDHAAVIRMAARIFSGETE